MQHTMQHSMDSLQAHALRSTYQPPPTNHTPPITNFPSIAPILRQIDKKYPPPFNIQSPSPNQSPFQQALQKPHLQLHQTPYKKEPINYEKEQINPQHTSKELIIRNIPYTKQETNKTLYNITTNIIKFYTNENWTRSLEYQWNFTCRRAIRKQPEKQNEPPKTPITIVSFKTLEQKKAFQNYLKTYKMTLTLRDIDIEEEGNIYIHDSLPKNIRELLYHTRQFKTTHEWRFAWTRDGQVYIRQTETSKVILINDKTDLQNLLEKENHPL